MIKVHGEAAFETVLVDHLLSAGYVSVEDNLFERPSWRRCTVIELANGSFMTCAIGLTHTAALRRFVTASNVMGERSKLPTSKPRTT